MIRAVIFDLDGTLVDSNDLHVEAWDETFRHFGKEFSRTQLRKQIGKGGDQYLPEFLSELELRTIGDEINKFRGELFKRRYLERVQPFPKVRELCQRLHDDGKRIALASSGNGDEVDHYVKLLGIGDFIEAQTTKTEVKHSKPRPDVFTSVLHMLGLQPDEAVAIGDTLYDVRAAKKIELPTIAVLCGGFPENELRAEGAIAIFKDPEDLLTNYPRSPLV